MGCGCGGRSERPSWPREQRLAPPPAEPAGLAPPPEDDGRTWSGHLRPATADRPH